MAVVVTQRDTTGVPAAYGSYVEWSAVFAGAVIAAGFSFVLLTFGAGIGLSLVSPYPAHSYGRAAASIAAFWALVVPIAALLIGGYVAGRLRAPREGADATETDFRDGMHGVLVWAVSVLAGAVLTFLAAGATAQGGFASRAPADSSALYAPVVATLFSPVSVAEATLPAQPTALPRVAGVPAAAGVRGADDTAAGVIATAVAAGQLTAAQRGYLAAQVSQRTGLPAAEAEQRVNQAYAQARDAADKARLAAVVGALVAATALLLGLAGAWYGAQQGGRHRDTNIPARIVWGWKVRPGPVSPG